MGEPGNFADFGSMDVGTGTSNGSAPPALLAMDGSSPVVVVAGEEQTETIPTTVEPSWQEEQRSKLQGILTRRRSKLNLFDNDTQSGDDKEPVRRRSGRRKSKEQRQQQQQQVDWSRSQGRGRAKRGDMSSRTLRGDRSASSGFRSSRSKSPGSIRLTDASGGDGSGVSRRLRGSRRLSNESRPQQEGRDESFRRLSNGSQSGDRTTTKEQQVDWSRSQGSRGRLQAKRGDMSSRTLRGDRSSSGFSRSRSKSPGSIRLTDASCGDGSRKLRGSRRLSNESGPQQEGWDESFHMSKRLSNGSQSGDPTTTSRPGSRRLSNASQSGEHKQALAPIPRPAYLSYDAEAAGFRSFHRRSSTGGLESNTVHGSSGGKTNVGAPSEGADLEASNRSSRSKSLSPERYASRKKKSSSQQQQQQPQQKQRSSDKPNSGKRRPKLKRSVSFDSGGGGDRKSRSGPEDKSSSQLGKDSSLQRHLDKSGAKAAKGRPKLKRALSFDSGSGAGIEKQNSQQQTNKPSSSKPTLKRTGSSSSRKGALESGRSNHLSRGSYRRQHSGLGGSTSVLARDSLQAPLSNSKSPGKKNLTRRLPPRNNSWSLKKAKSKRGKFGRSKSFGGQSTSEDACGQLEESFKRRERGSCGQIAPSCPDDLDVSIDDDEDMPNDLSISDIHLGSSSCSSNARGYKCSTRTRRSLESSRTKLAVESLAKLSDSHTTVTSQSTADSASMDISHASAGQDRMAKMQQIMELRQSWKTASVEAKAMKVSVPTF